MNPRRVNHIYFRKSVNGLADRSVLSINVQFVERTW